MREYRRLLAAGVNPEAAAVLAGVEPRRPWTREAQRRVNQRPVLCPQCHLRVQAGNLARHRRTHEQLAS